MRYYLEYINDEHRRARRRLKAKYPQAAEVEAQALWDDIARRQDELNRGCEYIGGQCYRPRLLSVCKLREEPMNEEPMFEEPTQPTKQPLYTPRQPVKKWPAQNGFTYDSPIEAIQADLQSKAQEVNGRLQEVLTCRRKDNQVFDALVNRNLKLAKAQARDAIAQLKRLCDEYELQAAEDARAGK